MQCALPAFEHNIIIHWVCTAANCRLAAGGKTDGDDVAQILKAAWRETRSSVMRGNGVAEFYFRQYLFACQARLLFKLNRPTEVCTSVISVIHTCIGQYRQSSKTGNPAIVPCVQPTGSEVKPGMPTPNSETCNFVWNSLLELGCISSTLATVSLLATAPLCACLVLGNHHRSTRSDSLAGTKLLVRSLL